MDWDLLKHFVAVAEHGSLSAAARASGVSQPTIGRAMERLEREAGRALFERHARGQRLTADGEAMLAHAREMRDAAARLGLALAGGDREERATVRLTASQIVATHILPPILSDVRTESEWIDLEIVASDANQNLLYRDADIAVRMADPVGDDLIARRVGHLPLGAYASTAFVERYGAPRSMAELVEHRLLGGDRSSLVRDGAKAFGVDLKREDFPVRCDDQVVVLEMTRHGCGIGFLPRTIADERAELVRLLPELELPKLPVWLVAHRGLRLAGAVRMVFDALAAGLRERLDGTE